MATLTGNASNVKDMVRQIIAFLTDPAKFGAGNEWKMLSPSTFDDVMNDVTHDIVLKGVGDGEDDIYIGISINVKGSQTDLVFNGYAGYDPGLLWREQPGAIYHDKLPILPLATDTFMTFWVTATTSRIIIVVEMSTQYEMAYLGLMKPIAIERQYPYPLLIGGSYYEGGDWTSTGAGHSGFTDPGSDSGKTANGYYNTSLRFRRPDGTWRGVVNKVGSAVIYNDEANLWPTNTQPVRTLTVYDNVLTLENVLMFPFLLYESNPVGLLGQLDGIYWIGNREDLSAKDSIMYNSRVFKVFSNVQRRDNDQYFAIEWV